MFKLNGLIRFEIPKKPFLFKTMTGSTVPSLITLQAGQSVINVKFARLIV